MGEGEMLVIAGIVAALMQTFVDQAKHFIDEVPEIARTAVSTDAKRVAQVVRDMVESDG